MSKIIFLPISWKVSDDTKSQGIYFVEVETKPFTHKGNFIEKNLITGKFEEKNIKIFSRLRLTFTSQRKVDAFLTLASERLLLEVESSKNNNVFSGKIGEKVKEYLWIHENNPPVRKSTVNSNSPTVNQSSNANNCQPKPNALIPWLTGGVFLIFIFGLFWQCRKRKSK